VWSSFGWACSPFSPSDRIGLQHDQHLVRGGHRPVGVALLRKLSLQSEEGRISFHDLAVDLGAEIFGGFERYSRFHRAVLGSPVGVEGQKQAQGRAPHTVKLALGPPRHSLSAAQTV
jgi:hypothetical protein